jgi:hypothetical protein
MPAGLAAWPVGHPAVCTDHGRADRRAQAGTTYAVIYGVLGADCAERRSWAMGVAAAAGSFGQFLMVPEGLADQPVRLATGAAGAVAAVLLMVPLALGPARARFPMARGPARPDHCPGPARGLRYPSFLLLMAGYFVCGFQVVFIGVHMPSYLKDKGSVAPGGQLRAGADRAVQRVRHLRGRHAGQRMPKRNILAFIYLARAVAITVFLLVPLSPAERVRVFASVMGLLWLSTVPPTNATIAQIFGVQHLSMLGGFVFFSHQIGSFMGVWLGGCCTTAPAATTSSGTSRSPWACLRRW